MTRDPKLDLREARAARTRARALSPVRILFQVLLLPVAAAGMTVSIYVAFSPFEREDALRHLASMHGCETAAKLGLANMRAGEVGYHKRIDPDQNGIACEDAVVASVQAAPAQESTGGAKFVRP